MTADKPQRSRKLGDFREVPNSERRNPQTIRRMIYDLIQRYHQSNIGLAASELTKIRLSHKQRSYRAKISQEALYEALRDDQWIKYLLLEAIAIERRVPLSLLLFYTRLCSDQAEQDGDKKTKDMIAGFSFVLHDAQKKLRRKHAFSFDDLIYWMNSYVHLSQDNDDVPETGPQEEASDEPTLPGLLD